MAGKQNRNRKGEGEKGGEWGDDGKEKKGREGRREVSSN